MNIDKEMTNCILPPNTELLDFNERSKSIPSIIKLCHH